MVYLLSVGLVLFTEDEVSPSAWQDDINIVSRPRHVHKLLRHKFKLNSQKAFATN